MIGPLLLVSEGVFLFAHQDMKMLTSLHGVVEIDEAMLMTTKCWHEDGRFHYIGTLQNRKIKGEKRSGVATKFQ